MAIPRAPHGAVIKRMPAEDDRNLLTGKFKKLLTEKIRFVAITQMSKRTPRSFCSRWLIRVRQAGVDGRIHKRRLHRSRRLPGRE